MDFNLKMAIAIIVFMAVLLRFGNYIFEYPSAPVPPDFVEQHH